MTAQASELRGDGADVRCAAIQQSFRAYATPTVIDAYNETPFDACVRHLSPVLRPNAAVLDLGCGEGALTGAFASQRLRAYGVDLDVERLESARRRESGRGPVTFLTANAESLPFASEQFDAIISVSVLQYVDWRRVVDECRRILRPGGRAAFLENLRGHPLARAYRVVRRRAWAYPRYQTPRGHVDWNDTAAFRAAFPGAQVKAYHLLTPLLLTPHALRERRPDRFSPIGRRAFDLLSGIDAHLLRRWQRLSRAGWLFTALCTKGESQVEAS